MTPIHESETCHECWYSIKHWMQQFNKPQPTHCPRCGADLVLF